jgi:Fic family protein
MPWNWQQPDWPSFRYDSAALASLEKRFLLHAGEFIGACKHISPDEQSALRIELIRDEALKTSEIEGTILNRASVQSSLIHQFGLGPAKPRIPAAERGIAEMMVDLYGSFAEKLSDEAMFRWHRMLMAADRSLDVVGEYRRHADPMQVVTGHDYERKVHFEAPPSRRVPREMKQFVRWFNASAPGAKGALEPLTRAGIAHLYFESIHPFEDGNGRIGRALSEKALAQALGQPSLIALAYTIERKRRDYYTALERNSRSNEITDWLVYFAMTILEAQDMTIRRTEFYLAKARFFETMRDRLNKRQEKAIARMFREGIDGFKGGMSAEKYVAITGASRATATRDLNDLVAKNALTRTGERRHARYHLNPAASLPDREPLARTARL